MSDENEDKTMKAIVKGRISEIIPDDKPKPATRSYSSYGGLDYGRRYSDDLFSYGRNKRREAGLDGDLNDRVDDLYRGGTRHYDYTAGRWVDTQRRTSWREHDFMPEIPDFLRRTTARQMNATTFEPHGDRGDRNGVFATAEIERLASVLNAVAADLLQHQGIIWKTEASQAVKACLLEQIKKNCLYLKADGSYTEIKVPEKKENDNAGS